MIKENEIEKEEVFLLIPENAYNSSVYKVFLRETARGLKFIEKKDEIVPYISFIKNNYSNPIGLWHGDKISYASFSPIEIPQEVKNIIKEHCETLERYEEDAIYECRSVPKYLYHLQDISLGNTIYRFIPANFESLTLGSYDRIDIVFSESEKGLLPAELLQKFCSFELPAGRAIINKNKENEECIWIGYTKDVEIKQLKSKLFDLEQKERIEQFDGKYRTFR